MLRRTERDISYHKFA